MPARGAPHSAAVPKSADRRATPTIYTNGPAVWFRRTSSAVRRNRTGAPGSHHLPRCAVGRTWDKKDGRAAPRSHLRLKLFLCVLAEKRQDTATNRRNLNLPMGAVCREGCCNPFEREGVWVWATMSFNLLVNSGLLLRRSWLEGGAPKTKVKQHKR